MFKIPFHVYECTEALKLAVELRQRAFDKARRSTEALSSSSLVMLYINIITLGVLRGDP